MPEPAPNPDLLPSLGRVVRGLSILFWCLPSMLLIYVQTARTDLFRPLGWFAIVPALVVTSLLWFAVKQLRHFRPDDLPWSKGLESGQFLLLVNLGLIPFLILYHGAPLVPINGYSVGLLGVSSVLFIHRANLILGRLTDLLPDEPLRHEAQLFINFNRTVLFSIPVVLGVLWGLGHIRTMPNTLARIAVGLEELGPWMIVFLILLPTAMTMTLIWKVKEFILHSVFSGR